jgi:hypothetical protein
MVDTGKYPGDRKKMNMSADYQVGAIGSPAMRQNPVYKCDFSLSSAPIVNDTFGQSLTFQRGPDEARDGVDTFHRWTSVERPKEIPVEFGYPTKAAVGVGKQHDNAKRKQVTLPVLIAFSPDRLDRASEAVGEPRWPNHAIRVPYFLIAPSPTRGLA